MEIRVGNGSSIELKADKNCVEAAFALDDKNNVIGRLKTLAF